MSSNTTPWSDWSDPQAVYFTVLQAGVPGFAEGVPGVAKSALHFAFARSIGLPLVYLIGSCRAPEDFGGLPEPLREEGFVRMMPTEWAHSARQTRCVVAFDEFTTMDATKQAPVLSIATEKRVGDTPIHPDTIISACANPPDMATNGTPLSKAMANRFFHHRWSLDVKKWLEGMIAGMAWVAPSYPVLPASWRDHIPTYSRLVAGFIRRHPDLLVSVPADDETLAYPTPRSWTNTALAMAAGHSVGSPAQVQAAMAEGCVGKTATIEFMSYVRNLDLIDPESYLDGTKQWSWDSDRHDRNEAFLSALFVAVKGTPSKERWERAMDALMSAAESCPEAALLHLRDALECKPARVVPSKGLMASLAKLRERCSV